MGKSGLSVYPHGALVWADRLVESDGMTFVRVQVRSRRREPCYQQLFGVRDGVVRLMSNLGGASSAQQEHGLACSIVSSQPVCNHVDRRKRLRIVTGGFRVGMSSRGRFATPADFPVHRARTGGCAPPRSRAQMEIWERCATSCCCSPKRTSRRPHCCPSRVRCRWRRCRCGFCPPDPSRVMELPSSLVGLFSR